jgi:hypothetical protein
VICVLLRASGDEPETVPLVRKRGSLSKIALHLHTKALGGSRAPL